MHRRAEQIVKEGQGLGESQNANHKLPAFSNFGCYDVDFEDDGAHCDREA
jgi:hypothetical protein